MRPRGPICDKETGNALVLSSLGVYINPQLPGSVAVAS